AFDAGPGWCFRRFGQSKTKLPDGRIVLIGGEHEDFYDPDFYIYNDVVIKRPDADIEIYGYPADVFPPNDFRAAKLVDHRIIIIGCLGYANKRKPGATPVYSLDLQNFRISAMDCAGTPPGWLHGHKATYLPEENSILITGGLVETGDEDRTL